jgi:hypothetical protein
VWIFIADLLNSLAIIRFVFLNNDKKDSGRNRSCNGG